MVRNKNGISAVVAVILTILITVAGVGIIWGAILPMIKNSASFSDLDIQLNVVKSGGYTFWDEDAGRLYVQVSRGVDEVDMTGVKLIVSIEGTTVVYPDQTSFPDGTYEVPGVNGKRTYVLNVTERPDSVKAIALVVVGKNEKEISSSGALNGLPVSSASDGEKELSVAQSSDSGDTASVVRDPTPRSCSEVWGASCKGETGLGDYSFDSCSSEYYYTSFLVDDAYVNSSVVVLGDTIKITCDFDCFIASYYNDIMISYYNGTWNKLWGQDGSCTDGNYSVDVVVSGNVGEQYVRCSIAYNSYSDQASSDTCFDTRYSDNDDVNFTVVSL